MARFEITAPDGKRYEINAPDGATQDQVLQYAQSQFGANQPQPEQPQAPRPQGDGGFRGSALGGLLQGLRDPLDAGAQILSNIVPEGARNAINRANNYLADKTGLVGRLPEGGIDEQIRQNEQEYQQARQAAGRDGMDAARMTGNIGATLPLAFVPGMQIAQGKKILDVANIARGAAQGGLTGALQPVTRGDFSGEKLGQIAQGAAFGAASAPIGAALGRMLSPQTRQEVKTLMSEGVTPTPGQIMGGALQRAEDKAMSIPLLGDAIAGGRRRATADLNRAAYARALKGTEVDAKSLSVGREGIDAVERAISDQYDDLLPKLVFKPDSTFNQELSKIRSMAQNLPSQQRKDFNRIVDESLAQASPNGTMIGDTYKAVESALLSEAKAFGSGGVYEQKLGRALKEVSNSMKSAIARSNPQYAKELTQANSNYANYVRLRNAGARAGDQSAGFSPAQLAAAVRATDKSVGKGATSSGRALMQDLSDAGVNVLSSKYPDSGTVGRGLFAGGLGAAAYADPTILAAALSALPYTSVGQRMAAALLTQRPELVKALGPRAQQLAPLVGGALAQPLQN